MTTRVRSSIFLPSRFIYGFPTENTLNVRVKAARSMTNNYTLAGGTVDITVHEVQADGNVKELYKANGGPWGGKSVNEAFLQFLRCN